MFLCSLHTLCLTRSSWCRYSKYVVMNFRQSSRHPKTVLANECKILFFDEDCSDQFSARGCMQSTNTFKLYSFVIVLPYQVCSTKFYLTVRWETYCVSWRRHQKYNTKSQCSFLNKIINKVNLWKQFEVVQPRFYGSVQLRQHSKQLSDWLDSKLK